VAMTLGIVILTRNLRLYDNLVIEAANKAHDKVLCAFVIDAAQFTAQNKYLSPRCLSILVTSVLDLAAHIPLSIQTMKSFTALVRELKLGI
jgi:deoxyribodipyrimidine photolyase